MADDFELRGYLRQAAEHGSPVEHPWLFVLAWIAIFGVAALLDKWFGWNVSDHLLGAWGTRP